MSFSDSTADALRVRAAVAHSHGDHDAADRLNRLAAAVEAECEYAANVDRGLAIVTRRADAPPGAVIGWYLQNDPAVRASRRALGVSVPVAP